MKLLHQAIIFYDGPPRIHDDHQTLHFFSRTLFECFDCFRNCLVAKGFTGPGQCLNWKQVLKCGGCTVKNDISGSIHPLSCAAYWILSGTQFWTTKWQNLLIDPLISFFTVPLPIHIAVFLHHCREFTNCIREFCGDYPDQFTGEHGFQ